MPGRWLVQRRYLSAESVALVPPTPPIRPSRPRRSHVLETADPPGRRARTGPRYGSSYGLTSWRPRGASRGGDPAHHRLATATLVDEPNPVHRSSD